jgi:hypothetical protein
MDEEMSVQASELGFHVYVDVGLALAPDTLVSGSFVLLSLADNSELVFSLLSLGLVLLKDLLL